MAKRAVGFIVPEEKIFCNANGDVTRVQTEKYYPPDTSALMYWLNNRAKGEWAYTAKVEHSGKIETSDIEARMMLRQILGKMEPDRLVDLERSLEHISCANTEPL